MCGIAGILYRDSQVPVDRASLRAMADAIAHRGPDAEGFWSAPGIGLAHRRLSIIDLASGQQPLANEDDSVQVVFNGEIYNYRELRDELVARGHRFRTSSDTEVLVHLYEECGPALVERLRGMFALALWDCRERRLVLARDRVGIKPLYFYRDSEKLFFASEIKGILAHPGVRREIDAEALEDYLAYGCVVGSRSIFKRVEKLPAAHVMVASAEDWHSSPKRYWKLSFVPDERLSEEEWEEAVRAKVCDAVNRHLIADVSVGAFLSGGLDSSIVVAEAARVQSPKSKVQSQDPPSTVYDLPSTCLQTFSMGFHEAGFSELPYARQVARQFNTQHTEEIVTADAAALVEELAFHFDEPFADSSAVPTYMVSRLARRHVKVVLSGDGGDEAFGGYSRYAHDLDEAKLRARLPAWFRRAALAPLGRIWPKADWLPRVLRAKTRLTNLALDADAAYANTLMLCRMPYRRRLLAVDVAAGLNGHRPEELVRQAFASAVGGRDGTQAALTLALSRREREQSPNPQSPISNADVLSGMLAADTAVLLTDDFLTKVDRATMAHGLEARPPLLDHELLELAARMPSRFKVRRGETKWIAKRAYENRLPRDAVWRKKHGFEIPVDAWLRGPLRDMFESCVLARQAPVAELINQAEVARIYRAHRAKVGRHGGLLWAMLMLAKWRERWG